MMGVLREGGLEIWEASSAEAVTDGEGTLVLLLDR
jgi:hypothetical protein